MRIYDQVESIGEGVTNVSPVSLSFSSPVFCSQCLREITSSPYIQPVSNTPYHQDSIRFIFSQNVASASSARAKRQTSAAKARSQIFVDSIPTQIQHQFLDQYASPKEGVSCLMARVVSNAKAKTYSTLSVSGHICLADCHSYTPHTDGNIDFFAIYRSNRRFGGRRVKRSTPQQSLSPWLWDHHLVGRGCKAARY